MKINKLLESKKIKEETVRPRTVDSKYYKNFYKIVHHISDRADRGQYKDDQPWIEYVGEHGFRMMFGVRPDRRDLRVDFYSNLNDKWHLDYDYYLNRDKSKGRSTLKNGVGFNSLLGELEGLDLISSELVNELTTIKEDASYEWKPDTSFKHIKDIYNKVKDNGYKYVNNEREEFMAAVKKADAKGYKPEQCRQIRDWHREIWQHNRKVDEAIELTNIKTSRIPRNATKLKGTSRHSGEPKTFVKTKSGWAYDHNGVYVNPDTIRYGYTDVEVIDTDPNYKPKRTKAEYVVQGNYGYGWEDLTASDDQSEAKNDLKAYRENETGVPHRLITRRIPVTENLKEAFKPSGSGIQSVKCYNRYNYTIQELRIDNDNKTFERGQFTTGKPDKKTKNRQEFEDIVDSLTALGYTEIKSDYRSMRNKTRNGVPTNESKSISDKESAVENFLNKYGFTEERYPHITNSHNNVQWDIVNVSFVDGISAKDFSILKKNVSDCGASGIYLANVHKDSTDDNELWANVEFEFSTNMNEGYQPADEWWLKVSPGDFEGAAELKGLYADDMIKDKNSLEKYGLSDRLTAELRKVFARYGSPVEYPEDKPVQHTADKKIEDYREELQAYMDKETGRPHKFFVDATFDGRLCIDINWGDWKHEHLFADRLVREFFESKGLGIRVEIETTEENGGDAYSATHYYSINCSQFSGRVVKESAVDTSTEWKYTTKDGRERRIRQYDDDQTNLRCLTRNQAKEIADYRGYKDGALSPIGESNEDTGECWAVFATDKSTGKEYCAGAYKTKAYAERAAAWDRNGDIEYGYGDFVYRVEQVTEYANELWKSSLELDKLKLANSKRTNEGFEYDDDIDSFDYDETTSTKRYEFVKSKSVIDMDGFNTDYTMYHDLETDTYVFVFGDSDIYGPEDGDFDWECDSLAEAEEWFDSYTGFEDDLDLMGESYDLSADEKKLLIMGQDMGSWYDEILDNEEILNRYYDAENKAKRIASASNMKLSDFIDSLSEDASAQNNDETKSPIVAKRPDGSYLVPSSSGDGYTAFNKSDVCMGHISGSDDNVAKSKFNANKFDESLSEELSGSGWWSVKWDLTLDGEEIRFDDLSETSQEHIADSILDGYLQGEIAEWDDNTESEVYGWWVARFDISVEDDDSVRFDDLSETSQEHIATAIKDGYVSGEIFE